MLQNIHQHEKGILSTPAGSSHVHRAWHAEEALRVQGCSSQQPLPQQQRLLYAGLVERKG